MYVKRARQLVASHGSVAAARLKRWQRGSPHRTHCAYAEEDDEVVGGEWAATMGVYSKGRW